MQEIEDNRSFSDVDSVKRLAFRYWWPIAKVAASRAWNRVFANPVPTVIAGFGVALVAAGLTYFWVGASEAKATLTGFGIGFASLCAVWLVAFIVYMARIPAERDKSLNDKLKVNTSAPVLAVECGEVQVGSDGQLLFRVRISANEVPIDHLECEIYDVMALDKIEPLLENRLRAMRNRPLERMHYLRKCQRVHNVSAGGHADYDLMFQTAAGHWLVRFAMDDRYDEPVPHGRYRFAVRARANGFHDAIGHFDAWEGNRGWLCFNKTGHNVSLASDLVAAIEADEHQAKIRGIELEAAERKRMAAVHEEARARHKHMYGK